ncbi:phosphatase [Ancylomarina sp. 16SWW S1-10-2]|uniref:Ppx/GppA phosphatase family protein n=1 Tax=Ancylomarina sp. 16SWW S1-10-2 TaxID=2499681 RepID=UPI0012ADFDDF|nr:phosphatase [Ancylomarina sp. 16SWW S1-10-2]MRT91520.1 phosphatase [Ancylomarina sp. 16SWW S1-10-2]
MRISIIDLGTNTFNLLVAEITASKQINILHRSKYPVKLGEGGINQNYITDEAQKRAHLAFVEMKQIINSYQTVKTIGFATSAIRTAENGQDFVKQIHQDFDIEIEVISGNREAELIYYGTREAVGLNDEIVAILDIGGGSNEIIIANADKIFWKKSYPIGMIRLLEHFHPSDPIKLDEIKAIEAFLKDKLSDLIEVLKTYSVKTLIGSSGSFSTLRQVIMAEEENELYTDQTYFNIKLEDFNTLHKRFLESTLEERMQMEGMDATRVHLMVVASVFINFLVKESELSVLFQSAYALKEGALFDYLKVLDESEKLIS